MAIAHPKTEHVRIILPLVVFVAGIVLGGAGIRLLAPSPAQHSSSGAERPLKAPARVSALGRIQPEGGVLNLGIPMPDRLLEIYPGIKEESSIKKGQPLVKLESYAARTLDLDLLNRQLADARAKLDAVTTKGQTQIELDKLHLKQVEELHPLDMKLLEQQIKVLAQQAELAHGNLERLEALGGSVSPQELEQQRLKVLQADTEATSARQKRDKADKAGKLEIEGAKAQLAASRALLVSAQKEVPINTLESQRHLAELRLQDSILHAPGPGTILKIFAHPGELVGAQQPILQMADTEHMVVIAEVYETDIHRVKKGDKAVITGRALQQKLDGEVVQVGAMIGKNRIVDVDPTADVDRRVIDVKIRLKQSAPAAKLINHQVLVEIDTAP